MSLTDDILMHYGMPRRSGRYPWGSGDNPYQHSGDFLSRVEELKKSNFTFTDKDGKTYTGEVAIAKSISLAVQCAEKQLRDGTASSQVITHYLKLGSSKERIEKEILEKQKELIEAKTKNLNSNSEAKELYNKALEAFRRYSGAGGEDDEY